MRKAFDTKEHNLLWYKLQRIGVRGKLLTAIQSLYNEVKCTVRVNDETGVYTVPYIIFSLHK